MANWSDLKTAIEAVIKQNGNREITGDIMQGVLVSMVSNLGDNCTYVGLANRSTVPPIFDGNVFYFASEIGTYPNFGGVEITDVGLYTLVFRSSWSLTKIADFGENDHDKLNNLDLDDQHPINAIIGLVQAMQNKTQIISNNTPPITIPSQLIDINQVIWIDTSTTPNIVKYFDVDTNTWLTIFDDTPDSEFIFGSIQTSDWISAPEVVIWTGDRNVPGTSDRRLIVGDYTIFNGYAADKFSIDIDGNILIGGYAEVTNGEYFVSFTDDTYRDKYQVSFSATEARFHNNSQFIVRVYELKELSGGLFEAKVDNVRVTLDSYVNWVMRSSSTEAARAAKILRGGTIEVGSLVIYAETIPSKNIDYYYKIEDSKNVSGINNFYIRNLDYSYNEIDSMNSNYRDIDSFYVGNLPTNPNPNYIYFYQEKMFAYVNSTWIDVTANIDLRNQVGRLLLRHNSNNGDIVKDNGATYLNLKHDTYPIGIQPLVDTELGGIYQYDKDIKELSSLTTNVNANGDTTSVLTISQQFTDLQGQKYTVTNELELGIDVNGYKFFNVFDYRLKTTSKVLTGAINEVYDIVNSFENKYASFIEQWDIRCNKGKVNEYGRYNTTTKMFECNGVLDILYEEANIMWVLSGVASPIINAFTGEDRIRTTLSLTGDNNVAIQFFGSGFYRSTIETIRVTTSEIVANKEAATTLLYYTRNVKNILGEILLTEKVTIPTQLFAAKDFRFIIGNTDADSYDFEIKSSPNANYDSLLFMIQNWSNILTPLVTQRTLTLHPDVFDKITNPLNPDYPIFSQLSAEALTKNIVILSA